MTGLAVLPALHDAARPLAVGVAIAGMAMAGASLALAAAATCLIGALAAAPHAQDDPTGGVRPIG